MRRLRPSEKAFTDACAAADLQHLFDDVQPAEGPAKAARKAAPMEELDEEELAANRNDVEVFLREHRERRFEGAFPVALFPSRSAS